MTKPLILDGGLGTHLEDKYGCNLAHHLWSSKVLEDDPEIIMKAHMDYFEAGAHAAITCTYRTNIDSFEHDHSKFASSINAAIKMAKKAADAYPKEERLIIGSVGPFGQGQRDGATFTGVYPMVDKLKTLEEKEATYVAFHAPRLNLLLNHPDVDVIGIETIPRLDEAVAMARHMCRVSQKPFFIAMTCCSDDKSTGHGEPMRDVVKGLKPFFGNELFWSFGLNCSPISSISSLLNEINAEMETLPAGSRRPKTLVYANSGETWNPKTYTWSGQTYEE